MFIVTYPFQILLFLLAGTSLVVSAKTLPSIWMDEAGEMNYYRFRAELQLLNSSKSFIIEEWVSVWRQMFRFDLIKSTGNTRTTFLANKLTNEKFRYKPFTCSLMTDDLAQDSGAWMSEDSGGMFHLTQDLGAWISEDLSGMFPSDSSNTLLPVGIGSLWLYALKLKSTFTPANDAMESRVKTSAQILRRYDKYTVPASETNSRGMAFYFDKVASSLSGSGGEASLKSLAMVEVHDNSRRVLMRIKILEAEENWNNNMQDNNDYLDLFDLPTGYGCQRATQFDHPFSMDSQSGEPYSLFMDMVSIQPKDLNHDLAQWKSHSMSVQLLTGNLELNDNGDKQLENRYLIMETQDYAPEEMSPKMYGSDMRLATVRRLKRVWDFGQATTGYNETHQAERNQIKYFELDLITDQCLKQTDLNNDTYIYLTRNPILAKRDLAAPLNELTLNTKLLQQFLFDLTGFHLLKDVERAHRRELVYERRFELFEMRNPSGELIWEGPISVVRYYKKHPFKQDFEITAVVYFLTDNRDKLLGKFNVKAQPKRPISVAHLHQSLNVAACFSTRLNKRDYDETGGQQMRQQKQFKNNDGIKFAITYSIEPQEIVEQAAASEQFEVSIYKQFLRALLYISNRQLDLMQLVDVDIDYDVSQAVAKVAARLVEKPSLLNYMEEVNLGFASPSPPGAILLTELKADEENCAESCQHYNCPMFVYCKKTKMCNLLMPDYKRQEDSKLHLLETDTGCSLFKARSGLDEPARRVNLAHLLHQMQRTILISSEEEQQERPLNELELNIHFINGEDADALVSLIPIKLESGALQLDNPDGLEAIQTTINNQLDVDAGFDDEQKPRAEYVLTFKNRKYSRPLEADTNLFPIQEAPHMSYEQCEALCEQSDCRSFSHCQLEQICQVSQLHDTSLIEKYIEQEDLCFVMTRDYLSKFELIFQVPKPLKNSLIKPVKVATSRDCAVRCMEEQNFKCLSFLYCPLISATSADQVGTFDGFDCYLRRSHAPTSQGDPSPKKASTINSQSDDTKTQLMCDLYTRSVLAEFDKYYGKALPKSQEVGEQLDRLVLEGFGSEFCALKCVELADGSCSSFQACFQVDSNAPTCTLLTVNELKHDSLVDRLIDDKKCTTFILSRDSELDNNQTNVDLYQISENNETQTKEQPSSTDESHWLTITLLLLIGSVVGYGITMKFAPRY